MGQVDATDAEAVRDSRRKILSRIQDNRRMVNLVAIAGRLKRIRFLSALYRK